jgi:hypothetical protein
MKAQQHKNSFGDTVANYAAAGATAIFLLAATGVLAAETLKNSRYSLPPP